MNKREIYKELKRIKNDSKNWEKTDNEYGEDSYLSNYLGTFMSLDPCGKYHHVLSPNRVTKRCERFWNNLEIQANRLDMWIESGEDDPCDIYLCKTI